MKSALNSAEGGQRPGELLGAAAPTCWFPTLWDPSPYVWAPFRGICRLIGILSGTCWQGCLLGLKGPLEAEEGSAVFTGATRAEGWVRCPSAGCLSLGLPSCYPVCTALGRWGREGGLQPAATRRSLRMTVALGEKWTRGPAKLSPTSCHTACGVLSCWVRGTLLTQQETADTASREVEMEAQSALCVHKLRAGWWPPFPKSLLTAHSGVMDDLVTLWLMPLRWPSWCPHALWTYSEPLFTS